MSLWKTTLAAMLLFASLAVAAACHRGPSLPVAGGDPLADASLGTLPADDGGRAALHIRVAGTVMRDLGGSLGGRTGTVVGDDGIRTDFVTDGAGSFVVDHVAAPYDVMIAGASGSPPTAYLGIERRDPWFELSEHDGEVPTVQPQTIRLGVRGPWCADASGCTVNVVTASASGSGSGSASCARGATEATAVSVVHAWRGPPGPAEELEVHAFVSCRDADAGGGGPVPGDGGGAPGSRQASRSAYAHGRARAPIAPGSTTDVGIVDAAPIPSADPLSAGARDGADDLASWRWSTEVSLEVAGTGAGYVVDAEGVPAITLQLPLLRGSVARVQVSAVHPRSDASGGFFRSATAWSGDTSLARLTPVGTIAVDLEAGPDLVAPEAGGDFAADDTLAWDAPASSLATLALADTARSAPCYRVFTDDEEIRADRLTALGIAPLEGGAHMLDLTTYPGSSVADATSPDADTRHRRLDPARPGSATYLRVPFQVAP
jgi:hypothetical protein